MRRIVLKHGRISKDGSYSTISPIYLFHPAAACGDPTHPVNIQCFSLYFPNLSWMRMPAYPIFYFFKIVKVEVMQWSHRYYRFIV